MKKKEESKAANESTQKASKMASSGQVDASAPSGNVGGEVTSPVGEEDDDHYFEHDYEDEEQLFSTLV